MAAEIGQWLSAHRALVALFVGTALVAFLLLRIQVALRDRTAATIEALLVSSPQLCAERLENNKRLALLFRRPVLQLWKLDAYMACGDDAKTLELIHALDQAALQPRDKLEFYQKRLSFFALQGRADEARLSRDKLEAFLLSVKAGDTEPYKSIREEADIILGVYIDKNGALRKKLIGRAEHTKNPLVRGVLQYRVAKLAYWDSDTDAMNTYLARAAKNLKNTWYEPVIEKAMEDPSILDYK